jgi:hypothetical protein
MFRHPRKAMVRGEKLQTVLDLMLLPGRGESKEEGGAGVELAKSL